MSRSSSQGAAGSETPRQSAKSKESFAASVVLRVDTGPGQGRQWRKQGAAETRWSVCGTAQQTAHAEGCHDIRVRAKGLVLGEVGWRGEEGVESETSQGGPDLGGLGARLASGR